MDIEKILSGVKTPCYVIDEAAIIQNLQRLARIQERTGAKILLAQKAFSMYALYPLIGEYLAGTTASSLYEAKLGYEEMQGRQVHIFSPAYREDEFDQIASLCDHIVFNSFSQWERFRERVQGASCGIRVNPEYSEIETDLYNPCFANSRLGTTLENFREDLLEGIDGLHFHTMCEQNSDTLERTLEQLEKKFGKYLYQMKWVNFGGGHHITREDYDVERLIRCISHIQKTYDVEVYLEPGEAVALNGGYLVSSVLDTLKNGMELAIIDVSAACHMPDVLEMPYRPKIIGAGEPGELAYTYRLGAATCLAGDVIGDYSFGEPLKAGDKLFFCDMAIYSMVKNNTFNGIGLPSILLLRKNGQIETVKEFGYEDFKRRL